MSTATLVPETTGLEGDDAATTLRDADRTSLLRDTLVRFRAADGTSHARSLALLVALAVLPGLIAVIGVATLVGEGGVRNTIVDLLRSMAPGPAGDLLTSAIDQGERTSASNGWWPVLLGGFAALTSLTTAFAQIERGANRLYGVERDRPLTEKYGRALLLALGVGALTAVGFVLLGLGRGVDDRVDLDGVAAGAWSVARWAIAIAAVTGAFALLFKVAPKRRQPEPSWLLVGSLIAVVIWVVATVGLGILWRSGDTFGDTYGPLAGVIGLLIWSYVTAIGLFAGIAFAAQLEAVRAGRPEPEAPGAEDRRAPASPPR